VARGTSLRTLRSARKCGLLFTLTDETDDGTIALAGDGDAGLIPFAENADDGLIPFADDDPAIEEAAARAAGEAPQQGRVFAPPPSPGALSSTVLDASIIVVAPKVQRSYASDVLWTFLFPTTISNLITWVAIWIAMSLTELACFFWPLQLVVFAWYSAFRFAVIESAAGGETEIPFYSFSKDFVAETIASFFKWIGSWAVVMLPAMAYLIYIAYTGAVSGQQVFDCLTGGLVTLLQPGNISLAILPLLVVIGVFLWPMVVLCVALGGFESLYRLDLIILTIIKSIGPYILTIVLMFLAVVAQEQLQTVTGVAIAGRTAPTVSGVLGSGMLLAILAIGLEVYFDIVLMRLIGMYYHHFKHRFAWDWG